MPYRGNMTSETEAAAKRLVRLAARIDAETWRSGELWYPQEARWIRRQAREHGRDERHALAAYAALSPRLQVGPNRRALVAILRGERPRGVFGRSVAAAEAAMSGHGPGNGPKVRAFDCNLAGCPECVTVDVWASKAAGLAAPDTAKRYADTAHAYRLAAGRVGVDPRTLQAAAWIHIRGWKPSDGRSA